LAAGALIACAVAAGAVRAQDRTEPLPKELEGIGVDEKPGASLPLDLEFVDHLGRSVRLRDYFDGQHPVLLTPNYYRCPMLCGLMLNGLLDGVKELDWTAGDQYRIVTFSFDPLETATLARAKRHNYLEQYGRQPAGEGWTFLTGRKENIRALLDAIGYQTRWNEDRQQWMHVAAMLVCTPDGRVSRYLYGIEFPARTLKLSLLEASQGKVGSTLDRLLLYCYHYEGGTYTLAVMNLVRAGALLTLLIVATFLIVLWRGDRKARAAALKPRELNAAARPTGTPTT
jgi:protein SCO1/2